MTPGNEQLLIDYLDGVLDADQRRHAEQLINEDETAAAELAHLQMSVELVREAAVLEQVTGVRKLFESASITAAPEKKESGAIVRSFSRNVFRVAAMVVLVLGATAVYKYSITTNTSVYSQNFTSFELETSRGANNDGELETAYRNKNWNGVEGIFSRLTERSPKTFFLAGMAAMELKEYDKAITYFNAVMSLNTKNANQAYQDEAEYYLGLAYLGAKKTNEGVVILRKIRSNKDHLFYQKASSIKAIDLELLEIKY